MATKIQRSPQQTARRVTAPTGRSLRRTALVAFVVALLVVTAIIVAVAVGNAPVATQPQAVVAPVEVEPGDADGTVKFDHGHQSLRDRVEPRSAGSVEQFDREVQRFRNAFEATAVDDQ